MYKHGVTQLDGSSKWNVVILGRVLALLFNEGSFFGSQAVEKFDENFWERFEAANGGDTKTGVNSASARRSPPKKRRHVRRAYDLSTEVLPRRAQSEPKDLFYSQAGDLATSRQPRSMEAGSSLGEIEIVPGKAEEVGNRLQRKRNLKVDSKSEFQSALRAGTATSEGDVYTTQTSVAMQKARSSGAEAAKLFVQAFADVSGGRRWMTAPSTTLSTIQESDQGDDSASEESNGETRAALPAASSESRPLHSFDKGNDTSRTKDEGLVTIPRRSTKQMRKPLIKKKAATIDGVPSELKNRKNISPPLLSRVISDDDIETAGSAFLDEIGKSLGLRYVLHFPFCRFSMPCEIALTNSNPDI
jgi:hypothetical protein